MFGGIKFSLVLPIIVLIQCSILPHEQVTFTSKLSQFECPSHCDYCADQICHKYYYSYHYRDNLPKWVGWIIGTSTAFGISVFVGIILCACFCCRCCCFASYPRQRVSKLHDVSLIHGSTPPKFEPNNGQHVNPLIEKC
ncbi:uncharacterized protein LOC110859022 [Folsomia candida]|uniref:Uncharacterized protein n=1 Tax=Folsomia candida TaxID=158441 RepID=A0A226DDK1_FOLCA|nr:uncharacterized protein LOC110859022 [Folsomia candida]OXA43200.1 hypothetical protein Fcan01_22048 [Folsomia candida]